MSVCTATTTTSASARQLRKRVPREIAAVLDERVPRTSGQVIAAISDEIPEYSRLLGSPLGEAARALVEQALHRLVEIVEHPGQDPLEGSRSVYRDMGRSEFRQGRSLDALLGAYRVGALAAWQQIVPACEEAAVEPRTVYALADLILACLHEVSTVSAEAFSAERAAAAGAEQAARQELVELLTIRPARDERSVVAAAEHAAYALPAQLAALVSRGGEPARLAARLGPGAIGARIAGLVCVLVPDPRGPGRAAQIAQALQGIDAALGPSVCPNEAARSWQWACHALELMERGAIRQRGLVYAEAHLGTMLVHEDEALASALVTRWLTPLEELGARARQGLPETLLAWLTHDGDVTRAAEDLHVHPQTVRYRLQKLRRQYGSALDDAEARFELQLALRAAGIGMNTASPCPHSRE